MKVKNVTLHPSTFYFAVGVAVSLTWKRYILFADDAKLFLLNEISRLRIYVVIGIKDPKKIFGEC